MGMAASQARLLSLTARKSNVEYEGQQINQQRTNLSNQSANLYNQMLTLSVPVPPSTDDYTKVTYTFPMATAGGTTATITQITPDSSGTYTVLFTYTTTETGFPACSTSQRSTVNAYNETAHTGNITTVNGKTVDLTYYDPSNPVAAHTDAYNYLKIASTSDTLYYVNVGTEQSPSYQYYKGSELAAALAAGADGKSVYYTAGDVEKYHEDSYLGCTVNRDQYNRVQSFVYNGETYAVTTTTTTDEDAYNDAYNEYTYQTYLYEKSLNDINAKTSVIQAQDKNLELRLKQLDTEHSAIQTEMEAVSSVIDKNVEDSFKTFA